MDRQDVEKLELRMQTLRRCFQREQEELERALAKLEERQMKSEEKPIRREELDYLISYLSSSVSGMRLDVNLFGRTMDTQMMECFFFLREKTQENL